MLKINPHLKKLVQDVITSQARRHWEHNAGSLSSPCTPLGQGQVIVAWVRQKRVSSTQTKFSFGSAQCMCNPVCASSGMEKRFMVLFQLYLYELTCFGQITYSSIYPRCGKTYFYHVASRMWLKRAATDPLHCPPRPPSAQGWESSRPVPGVPIAGEALR